MSLGVVSDLVAHARRERKGATVFQFGVQLALQAQQYMSLAAPVICEVSGTVVDPSHSHTAERAGAPPCCAGLTGVRNGFDGRPVGDAKRDVVQFHGGLVLIKSMKPIAGGRAPVRYRWVQFRGYIGAIHFCRSGVERRLDEGLGLRDAVGHDIGNAQQLHNPQSRH